MLHSVESPTDARVLVAYRGDELLVVALGGIGRAVPVRCSSRIPGCSSWLAGRAVADEVHAVWLLDLSPASALPAVDCALLAAGADPAWAVRIDRVVGLATLRSVEVLDALGWTATCELTDGRRARLLDPAAISRDVVGAPA